MAGVVRKVVTLSALALGPLHAGCAFPLNPPLESCQRLSQCPESKRDILFQINAGGPAVPPFSADTLFTDGVSISGSADIDLTGVDAPAPLSVYQACRYAAGVRFQYTFTQLEPERAHFVRLHFADSTNTDVSQRIFNVDVNARLMLNQVDVILEAGGPNQALVREFGVRPDAQGVLQLDFVSLPAKDVAQVCAIEIWRPN
jgi:hypothetical protein